MNATEDGMEPVGEAPELPWGHLEPEEPVKLQRAAKLLADNGYAVVKLPTATAPDFTGLEWTGDGYDVFAYGATKYAGFVQVRASEFLTPIQTSELAVSLLAAAKEARR